MYDIQVKDVTEKIPPKITTTENGGTYYVTVEKDKDANGLYTIITVRSTSNFKKCMEYDAIR